MTTLSFEELKPGREYTATDRNGKQYNAKCADVNGLKVVFCCYPMFAADGKENDLISFIEKEA
jgi:hypothetical protein